MILHYGGFPFNHLASCLHIYETPPSPSLPSSPPLPSAPLKSKGWRESVAQFRPTFFLKTSPPRATRFPRCERTRPSPSPPRARPPSPSTAPLLASLASRRALVAGVGTYVLVEVCVRFELCGSPMPPPKV